MPKASAHRLLGGTGSMFPAQHLVTNFNSVDLPLVNDAKDKGC